MQNDIKLKTQYGKRWTIFSYIDFKTAVKSDAILSSIIPYANPY